MAEEQFPAAIAFGELDLSGVRPSGTLSFTISAVVTTQFWKKGVPWPKSTAMCARKRVSAVFTKLLENRHEH
jgi:hypothetical protein